MNTDGTYTIEEMIERTEAMLSATGKQEPSHQRFLDSAQGQEAKEQLERLKTELNNG